MTFPYAAIIFDMDGVLVDSITIHLDSWVHAFAAEGLHPSKERMGLLEGMSFTETIELIFREGQLAAPMPDQLEHIKSIKDSYFQEHFTEHMYPLVQEILTYAASLLLPLVVVTGGAREYAHGILSRHFSNHFAHIITGDDTQQGKPSPEPYLAALSALSISGKDALVIENAPLGIRSAKAAGCTVFALATTLPRSTLEEADRVFETHADLLAALRQLVNKQ